METILIVLLLVCIGSHFFMHRGGRHGGHSGEKTNKTMRKDAKE